jgi:hypothetical protein
MTIELDKVKVFVLPDGRMDSENSALYVGLKPKTMAMMRCSGEGPEFIKRGKIFYFKDALDRWIADGLKQSTGRAA